MSPDPASGPLLVTNTLSAVAATFGLAVAAAATAWRAWPTWPEARPVRDPGGADRRAAAREGCPATPAEVAVPGREPAGALVLDRSAGGMLLAADVPLPVGGTALVRAAGGGPWVEVEVRHCRPHAGYHLAGCRFRAGTPPAAVRRFG